MRGPRILIGFDERLYFLNSCHKSFSCFLCVLRAVRPVWLLFFLISFLSFSRSNQSQSCSAKHRVYSFNLVFLQLLLPHLALDSFFKYRSCVSNVQSFGSRLIIMLHLLRALWGLHPLLVLRLLLIIIGWNSQLKFRIFINVDVCH